MPQELIVESPRKIAFRSYEDPPLAGEQVLVRTTVSGIKSGTEINLYRGQVPFVSRSGTRYLRLFRPPEQDEGLKPFFPHDWAPGRRASWSPSARKSMPLRPGDLVHGEWKHRQTAVMAEARLHAVSSHAEGEVMLFTDPAKFALAAVHDAEIKLGDRVAVFGMGAIGLLAIQMARLNGARQVFAVDPIAGRLELARRLGADQALNPDECDVALTIKRATEGRGVDVALEISGVYPALQEAIRGTCQGGQRGGRQLLRRPGGPGRPVPRMAPQPHHAALKHAGVGLPAPRLSRLGPRSHRARGDGSAAARRRRGGAADRGRGCRSRPPPGPTP